MKEEGMMKKRCIVLAGILTAVLTFTGSLPGPAQALEAIQLPAPCMEGGMPLMQALKERQTRRNFSERKLPLQVLSDLLWAAFGISRPESGKRTAPSAKNFQEIDIYVALAEGLYLFDAKAHSLKPILGQDIRALTGMQSFVKTAPVNLVYVADYSRVEERSAGNNSLYSGADTGFIAQNVYLYCASKGLATVVRAWIDRPALAEAMKLRADQEIVLSQTVGYPGE
jgi:SagB-type dehydrogenase family enzyme